MRNLSIALFTSVIFWLSLYPYRIKQQIESRQDFPGHLEVFYTEPFASRYSTDQSKFKSSQQKLNAYLAGAQLAVESPFLVYAGKLPKIYMSRSMLDFGLLDLQEGKMIDQANYLMAQTGGPYTLNEVTPEGEISGLVEIKWLKISINDTGVIKLIQDDLNNIPAMIREGLTFYLASDDPVIIQDVLEHIQHYTGLTYTHKPFYDFLFESSYYLELRQARLQTLAIVFLTFCLLLAIFSNLSHTWYKQRETYRIERALGRSRLYFIKTWFWQSINQWLWGLLASTVIFTVFILSGKNQYANFITLLTWFLGILAVGLCLTYLVSASASRFPLARSSLEVAQSWRDQLVPAFTTFALVFGVSFLLADVLTQYLESSHSIKVLGADTLVATTTSAASELLGDDICSYVQPRPCSRFGISNFNLWSQELLQLEDKYNALLQFDPQQLETLDIKLTQGRFPNAGMREVMINEAILPDIRLIVPDFDLGYKLQLDYEVVGFFKTPPKTEYALFESIYETPVFIPPNPPDVLAEYFLPLLGNSGLVIRLRQGDNLASIKQSLRSVYQHLSFTQPAAYASYFAGVLRNSLLVLAAIFSLAFIFSVVAYHTLINTLLVKRMLEMAIWRLLGMNMNMLRRRLLRMVVYLPVVSGLFGLIVGLWFLLTTGRHEVLPYALICALIVTLLLAVVCLILIYQKTRPLLNQEINQAYSEVL